MKKPRYEIIAEDVISKITNGVYREGNMLDSERRMAEYYEVSSIVVNKAMSLLAEKGLVTKLPRKGNLINKIDWNNIKTPLTNSSKSFEVGNESKSFRNIPSFCNKKIITVAILLEIPRFGNLWEKVFADFSSENPEVKIQLEPIHNVSQLYDHKNWMNWDIVQIPGESLPYFVKNNFLFNPHEIADIKFSKEEYSENFLKSISFQGKLWGVPLTSALACDFFDLKKRDFLKEVFNAENFWDYWERIAYKGKKVHKDSDGMHSLTFLRRYLFDFFAVSGADNTFSYDDMRKFDSTKHLDFVKNFEKYLRYPGIFSHNLDGKTENISYIMNSFAKGEIYLLPGDSTFIADVMNQNCPFKYGIAPIFTEKNGVPVVYVNLNSISFYSKYPEECLNVLEYLGSYKIQKYFAENGRPVTNIKALKHLNIQNIDKFSRNNLCDGLAQGSVLSSSEIDIYEYRSTVVSHEMLKWQNGIINGAEMLENLRRKTAFYYRTKGYNNSCNT